MRLTFALLVLIGIAGIAFGVLTIITHATGHDGIPFRFENYGGPGPIIAGLGLVSGGLYLLSIWPRRT